MNNTINDKDLLIEQLLEQMDKVFFYCVKRCNSRADAEDLSQDILLDIIVNINKGIKIENFDYYIWQICKNHYSKYVAKKVKERENILLKEEIDEPENDNSSLDKLINSEKIAMINVVIKLLSKDYSEILYTYYIEDRSLSYIAEKLNLPLGTVKRRLFDIRNKLKEYLKMERLNGKKAFVPTNFSTSVCGYCNNSAYELTKSLINKNILFHSYDNPCTLEDYSLKLGISIPYIEEIVDELLYATFLTKEKDKYITNFPIITKENDVLLFNVIRENGYKYGQLLVEFAKKYFKKFKEIVNDNHFTDNELMWVFMFYINRIAEQYSIIKNDSDTIIKRKHNVRGSWDFHMEERYDKGLVYSICENWFGNSEIGIRGICHPGAYVACDDKLFNTVGYIKSINGTGDEDKFELEYLEYVIKNPNMKYSKIEDNMKYKIDYMIQNNYLYVEEDNIKFNFVLFNKTQFEKLNSFFEYHNDLKDVKEFRIKIEDELKSNVKKILPVYLKDDVSYLASGYFYGYIREYVIRAFADNGLIKPNDTNKRFNFNMYAWKYDD